MQLKRSFLSREKITEEVRIYLQYSGSPYSVAGSDVVFTHPTVKQTTTRRYNVESRKLSSR
ncbi:hypothetical protein ACSAZL_08495 [Methanosarcina sp. T3]|uniref:hypothetical protein n=1 Tax=Methanosarcina sp. T3 TaxID=3439062 RepID=UPI003F868C4C